MSLQDFLIEKQGARLSELKFLELLNEKCRSSHEVVKKNPLYKLMKGRKDDYMLYDPKQTPDRTKYWVDKIIGELSGWKRYPDRASCLRAYSSYERSGDEPHSYVVIPLDKSRLGISSKSSFYRSFSDVEKTMLIKKLDNEGLTEWVQDVAASISKLNGAKINIGELTSHRSLQVALAKIDRVLTTATLQKLEKALKGDEHGLEDDSVRRLRDVLGRRVADFKLYLQEKLDPENNGFSVINVESLKEYHDREIWIDSPCLLVRREAYVDLHKRGEIK